MLAKGPQWTSAGVPSVVWARLGAMASLSRAIMGPVAPRSAARDGLAGAGAADDDGGEAAAQIFAARGEREDGHDL